jgi:hypothetical protein
MTVHCVGAKEGRVEYKFKDKSGVYIVKKQYIPFEVEGKKDNNYPQPYYEEFNGLQPGTYNFTVNAPSNMPKNIGGRPEIWLVSGVWDDYGSIGSYSTPEGIVGGGSNVKIGEGYSVSGTVVNKLPVRCYVQGTVEFRFNKCQLIIKHQGQEIFSITGECPLTFKVACDNDCPEGQLKCEGHKGYPGYCCIDCEAVGKKLDKIRNILR